MSCTDYNGNTIHVGSTVTIVGYSDEFTVNNIKYGGDQVDLSANDTDIDQDGVNSNNVIVVD